MTTDAALREKAKKPEKMRALIAGPAAPEEQAKRLDEDPDAKETHRLFESMRNTVVTIGKRIGVSGATFKVDEAPRRAPSTNPDDDDQEAQSRGTTADDVIIPPFDFVTLCTLFENSGALRQNIDAIVTNVDGFGHKFEPILNFDHPDVDGQIRDILLRKNIEDNNEEIKDLMDLTSEQIEKATPTAEQIAETKARWQSIATIEKGRAKCFFNFINPLSTFTEVRGAMRQSRELMGNAAWEVLREDPLDVSSKISQVYGIPFVNVRLIRADKEATRVDMIVRKDEIHFETVPVDRHFRRYVRQTGMSTVYYKEFGDPRVMSRKTGRYYETIDKLRAENEGEGEEALPANELFHWKIDSQISAYGVPRWIGALLSVLGSRAAEEVNFLYFDNKAIPPMVLLVSGGRVSEESVKRLENYMEERIKGRENFHKIMILEGLPADADLDSGAEIEHNGKLRIELKPLFNEMQHDALFQNYDANNVNKIGRAFRQPPIMTGDTKDMNRSCYSDDTETLTENGWKLIDEIADDEKVAAYDPDRHRIEFVVPTERHVHEVENELLYHFKSDHTDVLVTAEHKMLMRPYYSRTETESRWRGVEAKDLTNSRFRFRVAPDPGTWVGEERPPTFVVPKLASCTTQRKDGHQHEEIKTEDWLAFLGYWISEGSLLQTKDPMSPYWVTLSQKKPEIREKIQALLDRLPWQVSVQESKDGTTRWKISNKCLRDYLLQNCGGKSGDKRIPAEVMGASEENLRVLYTALMNGDGTKDSRENRTSRIYYTKSTVLADQVQEIVLLLGYRTRIRWGAGVWRVEHSEHVETCLRRENHLMLVPYTGRVYCFAVPSHGFFVTRRNGKVAIQGNTAEVAKAMAEEQVYQPGRDEFDGVMDRHFMTNLMIHFWRFKTRAPVQRIPNDLVMNMKRSLEGGALLPNEARDLAADAFNIDLPYIDEDWANLPPKLALEALRQSGGGADAPGEAKLAGSIEGQEGDVIATGQTTPGPDGHVHRYTVTREDGTVKVVVRPGGDDDHKHEAEITKPPAPGAEVTVITSKDHDHEHELTFEIPMAKRVRQAYGLANIAQGLRRVVADEVERMKDGLFTDGADNYRPDEEDEDQAR